MAGDIRDGSARNHELRVGEGRINEIFLGMRCGFGEIGLGHIGIIQGVDGDPFVRCLKGLYIVLIDFDLGRIARCR